MPAKAELPDVRQLKKLCEMHCKAPFNDRDRALIARVSFASFDLVDLSLIRVDEMIRRDGTLFTETFIPETYNSMGRSKHVYIGSETNSDVYYWMQLSGVPKNN